MNRTELNKVLTICPGNPIKGNSLIDEKIKIPGDKSISHRAALFASFCEGQSLIKNFQKSGVLMRMLENLTFLGIHWEIIDDYLIVNGTGLRGYEVPTKILYCGNSATTLRLLAGALAMQGVDAVLDGSEGLRKRPMNRIVEPLQKMGVGIESTNGNAPIYVKKAVFPLRGIHHRLDVASAQVKTCLLIAGLAAKEITTIEEPGPSRDHTERLLKSMGVNITWDYIGSNDRRIYLTSISPSYEKIFSPIEILIPGDFSAAAFLIAAACLTPNSDLKLHNIGLNPTRTGLIDALLMMGANIQIKETGIHNGESVGNINVKFSSLKGIDISGELVVRMIDEFPAFAIVAACAEGTTVVHDATELRNKESDRISDLCNELKSLNISVQEYSDGFKINGGIIKGGYLFHHNDHRLAMALTIAGLVAKDRIFISQPEIIEESFPNFLQVIQTLGGSVSIS